MGLTTGKLESFEFVNHDGLAIEIFLAFVDCNTSEREDAVVIGAESPGVLGGEGLEAIEVFVVVALLSAINVVASAVIQETSAFHLDFLGERVAHLLDILVLAVSQPHNFLIRLGFGWLNSNPVHGGGILLGGESSQSEGSSHAESDKGLSHILFY